MKKLKFLSILVFVAFGLILGSWLSVDSDCKNSSYLLAQSQKKYDAQKQWANAEINMHIQESSHVGILTLFMLTFIGFSFEHDFNYQKLY